MPHPTPTVAEIAQAQAALDEAEHLLATLEDRDCRCPSCQAEASDAAPLVGGHYVQAWDADGTLRVDRHGLDLSEATRVVERLLAHGFRIQAGFQPTD